MPNVTKESRRGDDWNQWKRGWQYKEDSPKDKKLQKDRRELFKKNGNGWWRFQMKREEE